MQRTISIKTDLEIRPMICIQIVSGWNAPKTIRSYNDLLKTTREDIDYSSFSHPEWSKGMGNARSREQLVIRSEVISLSGLLPGSRFMPELSRYLYSNTESNIDRD